MMKTNSLDKTRFSIISNFFWRFAERFGAQIISFVVSIILARILEPSVYGVIALTIAISTLLQVFIDSGLGMALVQKKDADNIDFTSVFYFNITICFILYIIIFLLSPRIASFYKIPELDLLIKTMSITIVISGFKNIQQAYVTKHLLFKKFFFSTLIGTIISAIIGITMAYCGLGVWALVFQNLSNQIIDTFILYITVKWRPQGKPSFERLKKLLPFGIGYFTTMFANTIYGEIRQLSIGKQYNSTDLAYYNRGQQFPFLIVSNINASIDNVLFPILSNEQNNIVKIKDITKKAIVITNYIVVPILLGLLTISEPLVKVLLTDKWLFCVPYIRIFCLIYLLWPIHTPNKNAIKALGRSDILIKQELFNDVIGIIILFITINKGVFVIAIGYMIATIIASIINSWPNKKLINYGFLNQIKDCISTYILGIIMSIAVYSLSFIINNHLLLLVLQLILGVTIYLLGSILFKIKGYKILINEIAKK